MRLIYKYATLIAAKVTAYVNDLRGVSTVEYALMVVAVIAAVGVVAGLLGGAFEGLFKDLSDRMTGALTT